MEYKGIRDEPPLMLSLSWKEVTGRYFKKSVRITCFDSHSHNMPPLTMYNLQWAVIGDRWMNGYNVCRLNVQASAARQEWRCLPGCRERWLPITVDGRAVYGMYCFARSNTGIGGSNPSQGMDVCVRLFCVCVVLYVGSDLATGWSPSKEPYRLCVGLRNWKSGHGPTRGL
jgi:hypothetical protein